MPRAAVAGAGPAGCAAALALARAGVDVLVLERGAPGKDKPCGDALVPDAVELLAACGVGDHAAAGGRQFEEIHLRSMDRLVWTVPLEPREGWVVPRAAVDQRLRDRVAACAELRYEASVIAIEPVAAARWAVTFKQDGAEERRTLDGVVLATGAGSLLSRRHELDGRPVVSASMSAYVELAGTPAPRFEFVPYETAGYGWVFPLAGERANAGYCALTATPKQLRDATERYIDRCGAERAGQLRGGAGPLWSGSGRRWHDGRGLVSCGDAAGLVDPLTGEGISAALLSGREAGVAIAGFLARHDPARLEHYESWVRTTFAEMYRPTAARRVWANLCRLAPASTPIP